MSTIGTARLLVVSADPAVLRPLWSIGESNSWKLEIVGNAWQAMDRIQSGATVNLLLLDMSEGEAEDLHTLRWLRRLRPSLPIIPIGHPNDAGVQEESIRLGANEYIARPVEERQLERCILRGLSCSCEATDIEFTSDDVEAIGDGRFFIGLGPVMRRFRAQAALLAETDAPLLILGESGSGKEIAARLVHKLSVRSAFEFAKVRCAALPGDLLERELFGYESKSAAGPIRIKPGKLELCAKGTILLDDVVEMPLALQVGLVEVLVNRRFTRPGGCTSIDVDVRVLATSSINLERAVAEKRLDQDLYRYLTAYTIHLPPLRERKNEIPALARHFMHQLAKHYCLSARVLSPAILEAWQAYNWPGNLQELEACVKRYLLVGDEELLFDKSRRNSRGEEPDAASEVQHIGKKAGGLQAPSCAMASQARSLRSLIQSVKSEAEKNAISAALERTGWNRKAAARLLKVSYRTVLYKIEQYKMTSFNSPVYPGSNSGGNGNGHGRSA